LAGVDNNEPSLYWIDYMGTLSKQLYCAHGYASYFILSTLDALYEKDLTVE